MDLLEVAAGPNRMVTFDGRVLEVFGGSVRRFHVRLLSVTVSGPDKHGNRNVVLRQAGIENSLPVDEPGLRAASVPAGGPEERRSPCRRLRSWPV
jgi:hypothetical protein